MVARTRSEGGMIVVFSRDGEDDDFRYVPNGERAAFTAALIIASCGVLRVGDTLRVTDAGGRHDG